MGELAVKSGDFSFVLPVNHEVVFDRNSDPPAVTLRRPGDRGSTSFELLGEKRTADEAFVEVGRALSQEADSPYEMPRVQDEFERLRQRWRQAGGNETEFNAWAQGESVHEHLTWLRTKIRDLESHHVRRE